MSLKSDQLQLGFSIDIELDIETAWGCKDSNNNCCNLNLQLTLRLRRFY